MIRARKDKAPKLTWGDWSTRMLGFKTLYIIVCWKSRAGYAATHVPCGVDHELWAACSRCRSRLLNSVLYRVDVWHDIPWPLELLVGFTLQDSRLLRSPARNCSLRVSQWYAICIRWNALHWEPCCRLDVPEQGARMDQHKGFDEHVLSLSNKKQTDSWLALFAQNFECWKFAHSTSGSRHLLCYKKMPLPICITILQDFFIVQVAEPISCSLLLLKNLLILDCFHYLDHLHILDNLLLRVCSLHLKSSRKLDRLNTADSNFENHSSLHTRH